jgi:hypothetical protein
MGESFGSEQVKIDNGSVILAVLAAWTWIAPCYAQTLGYSLGLRNVQDSNKCEIIFSDEEIHGDSHGRRETPEILRGD